LLLDVGDGIVTGLASRIPTELCIVQLRAVGENDLLETPAGLPLLARARDKTVHDNAIFAALPRSKHSVGRKGTSDLLLRLGEAPHRTRRQDLRAVLQQAAVIAHDSVARW